jgi:hypothetical protein
MDFRLVPTFFCLASLLASLFAGSINFLTATASSSKALQGLNEASIVLDGSDSYVDFSNPTKLHLTAFTVECWFRRDGSGNSTSTGSYGITHVLPLVARGIDEGETANTDINYFLGIDTTQNVLAFDIEEGSGGSNPSLNHPLFGNTPITDGVWDHAAATYDGTNMRLYLNGTLENELMVGQPADSASNAYVSIGSALNTSGEASGYFDGAIDEVRIWNRALSQAEIRTSLTQKISNAANLVAAWSLDEGSGTTVSDSAVGTVPANGIVRGTGYSWSDNAPMSMNFPPDPAGQPMPANGASGVSTSPVLSVHVSDPEADALTVKFYGRQKTLSFGPMFTYVVLPDTQFYTTSSSGATIFNAQTQWIVDNRSTQNIPFVSHLGDITEDGDKDTDESEWIIADNAMSKLEMGTADPSDDVPFGVIPGNRDAINGLTLYEKYFGIARFIGRPYFGGYYGSNNTNNYSLFSASGLDFIVLNLNCADSTPSSAVLAWAGGLLQGNPNRRGIVTCHYIVGSGNPGTFSAAGRAIYAALKIYPNLFLMLGGHIGNEAMRQDIYNGSTVYSLLQDYQNIGKGWLRYFEFHPSTSEIHVRTYSPYLDQFQTDANSDFILHYDMGLSYTLIGSVSVPSGTGTASIPWPGLNSNTAYEWYASVSDAQGTTIGQTNSFTTAGQNQPPIANNDGYSTFENLTLDIPAPGVLANDTHTSGSALTASLVSNPVNGSLTLHPNGAFTYQPNANFFGTDSFTYQANDGLADSNVATVTIVVNHVNQSPVCLNVALTTNENATGQANPNCSDFEGNPLNYSIASQPVHGTASIVADKLVFTPEAYYNGTDSFTYKANDGQANSNVATVTVTINPVNYAPVADPKSVQTDKNKPVTITLTGSDVDGDLLTFSIISQPANGNLSDTLPVPIYTPNQDWSGTDSFTYRANDGQLDSNLATVTITVNPGPANIAPVCADITLLTVENMPWHANPNCTDAEGAPLTYSIASQPSHGTASIEAGFLGYTPTAHYSGVDSFTYQANDGQADSAPALVDVTISPVNYDPVAVNDYETTQQDTPVTIFVLANDTDVDQDPLFIESTTDPSNGSIVINPDKSITYTPHMGFHGKDSFTYVVSDGQGGSATAIVDITVIMKSQAYLPLIAHITASQ